MAGTRKRTIVENENSVQKMMTRENVGLAVFTMGISELAAENSKYKKKQGIIHAENSQDVDRTFTIEEYTKHYWATKIMNGLESLLKVKLNVLDVSFEVGGDESYIVEEGGNLKAKIGTNFIKSFEKSTNPNVIRQVNPGEISCALYDVDTNQVLAIFIIKTGLFYEFDEVNFFDIRSISPEIKIVLYAKNSQVKGEKLGAKFFKIIKEIFKNIRFTHAAKIDKKAIDIYKQLYPNHVETLVKILRIPRFVLSAAGKFARDFWIDQGAIETDKYNSQLLNSQPQINMYPAMMDLSTPPPDANPGASIQPMYGEGIERASPVLRASLDSNMNVESPPSGNISDQPYRVGNRIVVPQGYIPKKTLDLQRSIDNMNSYGGSKYTRKIKRHHRK